MKKLFSIIIPVYGNEENLPITIPYMIDNLKIFEEFDVEIIMVCDGSPDKSWDVMKELKKTYPNILRIYKLATNSYRQIATAAGMSKARGEVIGVISADMQDPFELFADMLKVWENGHKMVIARRIKRTDPGIGWVFSNVLHRFMKRIDNRYPEGGFDFFVMDSSLAFDYCQRITKNGFMPLVLLGLYDRPIFIDYERKAREVGKSGYSFGRKLHTAMTTFVIETDKIFYWFIYGGLSIDILSILTGIIIMIFLKEVAIGITVLLLGFIGGVIVSLLGLVGFAVYNWAVNLRGLPKYKIEKEGIESDE